ncbi:hypothetical protein B0H14DRAFT_1666477 [Mycena olivaceomarginata]|nr:hypothetical protein B0H14DRAFT_1666477 [Mycena olivaceomarginata]
MKCRPKAASGVLKTEEIGHVQNKSEERQPQSQQKEKEKKGGVLGARWGQGQGQGVETGNGSTSQRTSPFNRPSSRHRRPPPSISSLPPDPPTTSAGRLPSSTHPPLTPGASPPVLSPTARAPSPFSVTSAKQQQQPPPQTLRKKTPPAIGILRSLDMEARDSEAHERERAEIEAREREAREREHHERGRKRRDEEHELTRKIGFLTATASEDWTLVLDVCDHASATEANAKEAVRALRREFKYGEPADQLAAARLWAIMLRNSSNTFIAQSTSRKFLVTLEDLLTSSRTSPSCVIAQWTCSRPPRMPVVLEKTPASAASGSASNRMTSPRKACPSTPRTPCSTPRSS